MQSNKENVSHTPSLKEVRKRIPLQSPFSAASPNARPAQKKFIKPLYEFGDQNLDATEIVDEAFNMSSVRTGLSESIVETSHISAATSFGTSFHGDQSAPGYLAENIKDNRHFHPLPCDDNLEESTFGHTFTVNDSYLTESSETLKDDSSVQILCDSKLEETAADLTYAETIVMRKSLSYSGGEDAHGDTLNSANVTLANAEDDKEIIRPCDNNLEETSVEETFYQSSESQLVVSEDDTLKDENHLHELSVGAAPVAKIECNVKTYCDVNLGRTANEPALFDSRTNETTITITDSSVEDSTTKTFMVSNKDVSQTSSVSNSDAGGFTVAWNSEEKITRFETVENCANEKESHVHFMGDSHLEETYFDDTQSHTSSMESPGGDSVRVFVNAKASPLNSANGEKHSLGNELGELLKLNESVDIRVTALGNASMMADMDRTLQDDASSFSEDSRNFSSVSTALSDSKNFAETEKSAFLPDITQYGDVNMDITSYVNGGADDTFTALSTPIGKEPRCHTNEMETSFRGSVVEEEQLPTAVTAEKDTPPNSFEDTISTLERLVKPSTLPSEEIPSESKENNIQVKEESHSLCVSNEVFGETTFLSSRSKVAILSPIADLSRSNAGSRASTVRVASNFAPDNSPAYSGNRKYNMNDSEISFLLTENKIYDMHLRNAVESPEELDRLRSNIAQLESDNAELHTKLRSITAEFDQYKLQTNVGASELDELKRKLNEVTKGKEHAERTVSDYEFIVEDLKKRHNKQKEDLHAKVISLEEELESCRAHIRTQTEMTFTSSGLAAELNVAKEQLLMSEGEHETIKKRCEELKRNLEIEADKNTKLMEQIAEFTEKSEALEKEILELQCEIGEKETVHKKFEETAKRCHETEEDLKNAKAALADSTEENKRLKTRLETAMSDVTMLREIQTKSELELMKLKNELSSTREEDEKLQGAVATLKRSLEDAVSEAAVKSELLKEEVSKSADMEDKIVVMEAQVDSGKRALEASVRELGQLKDNHNLTIEELEKMKSALETAKSKLEEAEAKLEEASRSYERESEQRKEELQSVTSAHLAEKIELEKEVAENKDKIADLVQNLEKNKDKEAELEGNLQKLREENSNLQSELLLGVQAYEGKAAEMEEANKRISKLEEEIGHLHQTKDDLLRQTLSADQEKQEKDAEIEKLTSAAANCKDIIAALELERDSLKDQLSAAKERLDEIVEAEQTIESLKAEAAALTSERDDFESQLNIAKESKKELTDELDKVKEAFAHAQSESVVLASQKALLEENLQAKEEEYSEKLASFEQLKTQNVEYEAVLEQLKTKECNLNEELETVRRSLKVEQEAKKAVTREVTKLEEDNNLLKRNACSLEAELELVKQSKTAESSIAQKTIEDLKNQELELKKRLKTAEDTAQASTTLMEELVELKRVLAVKEKDTERLVRECDRYKELEAELTQQITDLRNENAQLRTQSDQPSAQDARQETESLKAEVEKLRKEKERLEKEVMYSSCKDIRELQECLVKKEEYIEFLGKQCDDMDELEDKYKKEIAQLYKERDALRAQIDPSSSAQAVPNLLDALTEGVKPLTPDHAINQSSRGLEEAEKEIDALKSEVEALKKDKERLEKVAMYSSYKDVKELQDCLVKKDEYIEFLGKQCDEIDELETQYKEEIAQLRKERDALKAQIDPSSVPVVPNLREALTKGVKKLSPDNSYNSLECKALEDYERKIDEFERIVTRLEKEKEQLQKDRVSQNERIIQQNEELVQLCEKQRKELEELKRDSSKDDETVKTQSTTFNKDSSTLKSHNRMKPSKLSFLDAVEKRKCDEEMMDEDGDKDGLYQSAPSSPRLPTRSFDSSAGPAYEESVVENAAATPDRTLHTTLYKKLDKTTKLFDSPESTKRENSRCAQQ